MYRVIKASKSAPLYHGTSWENAVQILETNELRGNVSNETETYGISFTRNRDSAYDAVGLVIDQEKLSYNYKIAPVYRDGISGLDLAEERVDRTIKNIRQYIIKLQFNNPVYLKSLRRTLIDHFDDADLLDTPKFSPRKFNIAYSINRVIQSAHKYNIPLDNLFQEAEKYIDMFVHREFDEEYYQTLQHKRGAI